MNQTFNQKEWLAIVNPNAGKGKGRKDWDLIALHMKNKGLICKEIFTQAKGDAILLARNAVNEGYRNIITVGGDGTLNEVVNGIFTNNVCPSTDVTLSLIPVGTGNDWGRMFGIPLDYEKAVGIIVAGNRMVHDTGVVRYHDGNEINRRYFINISGLGFNFLYL